MKTGMSLRSICNFTHLLNSAIQQLFFVKKPRRKYFPPGAFYVRKETKPGLGRDKTLTHGHFAACGQYG